MSERVYTMDDLVEDGVDRYIELREHRIPIVLNHYPSFNYITALVVSVEPYMNAFVMPTEQELAMVASFHEEYMLHWYGRDNGWVKRMRERVPFDCDGGANGRFLGKYDHGGWCRKVRTWEHAAKPFYRDEPMTLLQVLDKQYTIGDEPMDHWQQWKADHPDIFDVELPAVAS